MAGNARRIAVNALLRINKQGGYSNIVLNNILGGGNGISAADRALVSRLVYGVTERLLTLDYIIGKFSSVPIKKIHPTVLQLLRMGCYQLLYMEKIPESAAVNETVGLAKEINQRSAAGFINAVLRGIQRGKNGLFDGLSDEQRLSVETSCPAPLIEMWQESYGFETAKMIAQSTFDCPPLTVRVNTLKISCEEFEVTMSSHGVKFDRHPFLTGCYQVHDANGFKTLAKMLKNCYYHQDAASQICCKALDAAPGERIADVCAAPGGKSLTAALMMENDGEIVAGDIYQSKCDALRERALKMGADIIQTVVRDASTPCPKEYVAGFDRVLCDVPCSGFGVIRRKPEIKYKPLKSFEGLPELQYAIMKQSALMVRGGGVLQYSTCTLSRSENQQVAKRFLEENRDFLPRVLPLDSCFSVTGCRPSHQITLFSHIHRTDGFYIAGFIKSR